MNTMQRTAKDILCGYWMVDANALPDGPMEIPLEAEEEPDGFLTYSDNGLIQRVPLKAGLTSVGSAYDSDCVIDSPEIREKHAEIIRNNDGYSIKNLSAAGETRVNGRPLPANGVTEIPDGAVIDLSGWEMTFRRWPGVLACP